MALITLDAAAQKLGIPTEAIEQWAKQGLITIYRKMLEAPQEGGLGLVVMQSLVDEDELEEIAESLGWLQLSAEGWNEE